jgi:hypothetical protein
VVRKIKDNILKFSVDEFSMDDYNDEEFAIAHICFLSTKPNSHELVISDEVLKECAPSVLGKWLVAEYDKLEQDVTTHTADEWIMGYFPKEQEVEFIESDEGYLCAYANAIVSKIYAVELCDLFDENTTKPVSVEMLYTDDGGDVIQDFNIVGVTVLGKVFGQKINGSCPDANMKMVRFSQEEADEFYNEHMHDTLSETNKISEERRINMAEKTYKINKTVLKDSKWGDVDKTKLRNTIMEAKNKATLVKAVYLLVEDGWQDAPSEKLKYPVMELVGDTFYYNRGALASALGYAKAEGEDDIVAKVEKLYKKFNLDDDNKEDKEDKADMSKEIEFAAVDLGDMWFKVYKAIEDKVGYRFYICGLYEEDNKKFAIVKSEDGSMAKIDYSYTEDGVELIGEPVGVDVEFVPNEKVVKFAVPEDFEQYTKFEEDKDDDPDDDDNNEPKENDDDDKDDKNAEMEEQIKTLTAQLEEKENIIMEQEKLLKELKEYKEGKEALEKEEKVNAIMGDAKEYLEEDEMKSLVEEAKCCDMANLGEWENKVKAACFAVIQKAKMSDDTFRIDIPVQISKENETVWDRL